ncbi:MAG: hypothetical protein QOF73_4247 [Thermomicrobiales bacterium]|nr:hypothetical protein [Thermomicrobiales bacterium]
MAQQAILPSVVRGKWFPMSFEEFVEWAPDEGQAEWVDGEGISYVSNSPRHEQILQFLNLLFQGFLRVHGLGEVFTSTVIMHLRSRPSGRMPDLFVVLNENSNRIERRWYEGPADLALEILSESGVERDRYEKKREYETEHVPEYLIVDGREDGRVFEWNWLDPDGVYQEIPPDAAGRYHSRVLAGFWIDPTWLTQDPLPDPNQCLLVIAPAAVEQYFRRLLGDPPK